MDNTGLARFPSQSSLGRLLLWVSCCAVYFGLARQFLIGPPRGAQQWLLLFGLSAYTGLCWATALGIAWRWWSPAHDSVSAGEWMLFCVGIVLALDIVVCWLPATFPIPATAVMAAGSCLVPLIPALSRNLSRPWRLFFLLLALAYALPTTVLLLENLGTWPLPELSAVQLLDRWRRGRRLVVLLAALLVLIWEYRTGRHVSWWHCFGVALASIFWAFWAAG